MLYNNYTILRNLMFGDKKQQPKINSNIYSCSELKKQLEQCLEKNNNNIKCTFIQKSYENCIKQSMHKINQEAKKKINVDD